MSTHNNELNQNSGREARSALLTLASWARNSKGNVSVIVAFVLLSGTVAILSPFFLTVRNLLNLGTYASIMGTMAAGLTIAMLIGGLDVSQYSLAALTGMIVGIMIEQGYHPFAVIVVALASGVAGGAINGFIITRMKLNPIIATIGTMSLFRGGAFLITNGRYLRISEPTFRFIGNGRVIGLPFTLLVMAAVYAVVAIVLKYTKFGRDVYAVGGISTATRLAGINNGRVRFYAFVMSGVTAAIGGVLTVSQTAAAMPMHGQGNDLDGIAAVVLGGISLSGGRGNVFGTLFGVLILATLVNAMTLLGITPYWQMMAKGAVLILAVYVDSLRGWGYK